MNDCNCLIRREGDDTTACNEDGPNDSLCSKPVDHEGPHAACGINNHPMEVWEKED